MPSDGIVEAAVVVVVAPSPKANPVPAGCEAVDVRIEPNDKPAPAGAVKEVVVVVGRENGVAEAVGLLKAKLKPEEAAVVAGAPEGKYVENQDFFINTTQTHFKHITET